MINSFLRLAQTKDCREIFSLEHTQQTNPWNAHFIASSLEQDLCTVVESSEKSVLAYQITRVIDEEAELLKIATHVLWQRKNLATQLLCDLIQRLQKQGVRKIFLEVEEDNHAALNLYKKLLFTQTGSRKNYYKTNTKEKSAWIFQKNL